MSDLPSLGIPDEVLLDKLELFFSKTKNGGGEVESREFLDDSSQVVLTFAQDGGAWGVLSLGTGGAAQPLGGGTGRLQRADGAVSEGNGESGVSRGCPVSPEAATHR